MLHMVMRQRRRFAFALLLTQIALFNVWAQTSIIAVMVVGTIAGMFLIAASGHPLRRLIECGAVGVLASSRIADPLLMGVVFGSATVITYALLYSPILDGLPFRIGMRSRKTFVVNTDQRTTWSKLIPGQGHPAAYWTGTMMATRTDAHDKDTLYVTFENGAAPVEEITVTYLNLTPNESAKYLVERDTLLADEEVIMTYSLSRIDDHWTAITSDMRVSGLPLRHAAERFFDDVLGDELDSFATMISCKRIWRLRPASDIALTSEMGRDNLRFAVKPDNRDDEDPRAHNRMSA